MSLIINKNNHHASSESKIFKQQIGTLPIWLLCQKIINDANRPSNAPMIVPIPKQSHFDRVIDTQTSIKKHCRRLEEIDENEWHVVNPHSNGEKDLIYRKIRTGPNKYDHLQSVVMADLLKKVIEEEELKIEVAQHCIVPSANQGESWTLLQKRPPHCKEQIFDVFQALPYLLQLRLANDLCRLICRTGFLHVRVEDIGIRDGKLVLLNLRPSGLLRDISEEAPPFFPSIDECAQIGLNNMLQSLGQHNIVFRLAALRALSLQKDKALENDSQLTKLAILNIALTDPSLSKEKKLEAFALLPSRLKEFFQFLVWGGMKKPNNHHFGKETIRNHPEILIEIKNSRGVSLLQQVHDQLSMQRQFLSVQQALIALKSEFLQEKPEMGKIDLAFKELYKKVSREFIFKPLYDKLKLPERDMAPDELKHLCHRFMSTTSSESSYCLLDQLIMALQAVREDLSINSSKHRLREEINRTFQPIPLAATSKDQIDAKRFDVTIPKEVIAQRIRIVLVAYECAKFAVKFGGLGEAAYGISKGLVAAGHHVSVILMKSDVLPPEMNQHLKKESGSFTHSYKGENKVDSFYIHQTEGIQLLFVEDTDPIEGKDHYLLENRGNIYKDGILEDPREKWYGLKERMLYFSSAAAALIKAHRAMFDLVLINDWHGADAMRHLKSEKIPTLFIIHNNNYGAQGVLDHVSAEIPTFFGGSSRGTNVMLEGIENADQVVTVSQNFALEMQNRALGSGIDPWIREIAYEGKFTGISNGSNPDLWDPSTNKILKEWKELRKDGDGTIIPTGKIVDLSYRATDPDIFAIKNKIKEQLQLAIEKYYPEAYENFQLDVTKELLLFVSRYDSSQKGLDKLLPMIKAAQKQNVTVVIMGVGEDVEATRILDEVEAYAHVQQGIWVTRGKEENESLKIQMGSEGIPGLGPLFRAAATFGAMPSSFEPCGLFQFECWLFGVPVIASNTGGLADTVITDKKSPHFNGILFDRLEHWNSPEQDQLAMNAVTEAFEFWASLDEERKRTTTMKLMLDAKSASWTTAPYGLTPIEQYERVFAGARKNIHAREKKLLDITSVNENPLLSSKQDGYFGEGVQTHLYDEFGAHLIKENGKTVGVHFQVLAPHAVSVSVVIKTEKGEKSIPMERCDREGVWALSQKGVQEGCVYEYSIQTTLGKILRKADPFAFQMQLRPHFGSVVVDPSDFKWSDQEWMGLRSERFGEGKEYPLNVYELHLPSWKNGEDGGFLNYRELAPLLIRYCKKMHFTHIELLGLLEHPNDDSWGYQVSGFFAPTSRHGSLQDFQYFVSEMHRAEIAVIVDWVPYHFCADQWSLGQFDGSALFEDTDPFNGIAPCKWGSLVSDNSKQDVRNFLLSSAYFAFEKLHLDGLRVDAVTHLIDFRSGRYNYTPVNGSWLNIHGIKLMEELNRGVHRDFPGVFTVAENWFLEMPDTTPIEEGGYGFDRRWSPVGNAIQRYLEKNEEERKNAYSDLTHIDRFSSTHRQMIGMSHDEVRPGNKSLFARAPGSDAQKFANARLYLTTQAFAPGNGILTFMGCEFAQKRFWDHHRELDFSDLNEKPHQQMSKLTKTLNKFYNSQPAFWSAGPKGTHFEWVNRSDAENTVISYHRRDEKGHQFLVIHNFSTKAFEKYNLVFNECLLPNNLKRVTEVLNTDHQKFGGTGSYMNSEEVEISEKIGGIAIKLPSFATVVFEEKFDETLLLV
jgi:1,4-alpha-glucan branching enzyme